MQKIKNKIRLSASDLVNFLGCKHLTELDRKVVNGELDKPDWNDPVISILHRKGLEHESSYVKYLEESGLSLIDLTNKSYSEVENAMEEGYDIITQRTLQDGQLMGRTDILKKVNGKSKFGDYSYEVEDTKLSLVTKAGTVLQLCLYSELLTILQEAIPVKMNVVKPGEPFVIDSFSYTDFKSYYSLIKKQFELVISKDPRPTYPLPVSKCDICRWWKHCDKQWHDDDHLSLVAGMRSSHLSELNQQEIETREQFAKKEEPLTEKPKHGSLSTYKKLHNQAKIQYKGRVEKQLLYDLLPIEPDNGLNRLPTPSKGDLYFDIEGDHFFEDGGIEYLLGLAFLNDEDELVYHAYWGLDRRREKLAFEQFIDFVMERWDKYHDFYIYHYAPYEPSAVKRLAARHGTREIEVDKLLRAERFIDLFQVIRETLQASVESYSLKKLEGFTDYIRTIDLFMAASARRSLGSALELNAISLLPKDTL